MASPDEPEGDVTALLGEIRAGDVRARDRLVERVYAELRRVAGGLMRAEPAGHSLQPTALLHEALADLLRGEALRQAPNRAYLFGAAARAMREVLVDHARRRRAEKRGAGRQRLPLDAVLLYFEEQKVDVLALHDALERLAALNERQSQVVTLRFFGGLTVPEVAEHLGVSVSTVESDFRVARAWLRQQLTA
jgi:RNA polymerase sigma factor (TIGR02999 family)